MAGSGVYAPAAGAQEQQQQQPTVIPPPPPPPSPSQGHAIKSRVDMVVLHATVTDEKGTFISDLTRNNFRVFEDKVEQKISVFQRQDIPVTMGLVIDNSGSMREKRSQVNAAAMTFVRTSNPQDEVFVVNFNDEYYLDLNEDFTSDPKELDEALGRIDSRGSTALYDAVIGSLDHLKKGHKDKRVLLVITDGDDDASRKSSNTPSKPRKSPTPQSMPLASSATTTARTRRKWFAIRKRYLLNSPRPPEEWPIFPTISRRSPPSASRLRATFATNTRSATTPRTRRKTAHSAPFRSSCCPLTALASSASARAPATTPKNPPPRKASSAARCRPPQLHPEPSRTPAMARLPAHSQKPVPDLKTRKPRRPCRGVCGGGVRG
jgi:Mg-chelatase subunit ChlD